MIRETRIDVTTTGSAGSATGSTTVGIHGVIDHMWVDYSGSAPGTTDLTIVSLNGDDTTRDTIWTKTNSATDHVARPRVAVTDNAGTATGSYDYYSIPNGGRIKVSLAQCDALTTAVSVYVVYEEANV